MTAPQTHDEPRARQIMQLLLTNGTKGATVPMIAKRLYGAPAFQRDAELMCRALVSAGMAWHVGRGRYRARTDAERATGRMEK